MGGDHAPDLIIDGGIQASKDFSIDIAFVGQEEAAKAYLLSHKLPSFPEHVSWINASQVVSMHDSPASVPKEKPDSSLMVGLNLVASGDGDAFVSAGSTGAILSGATLTVKRIHGIRRAALSPFLPARGGKNVLLIDCGATAECTPEYLLQFACMGSFFASLQMQQPNPRIGLLNIGTEPTKGTDLQRETYELLTKAHETKLLNFVGNVEARDVPLGACDVIVADGYSGNILLKSMEGIGVLFAEVMKNMMTKNVGTKLASLALTSGIKDFKKMIDYRETGGTPLLGLQKPVIKAHGSSDAKSIRNAINQARKFAEGGVIAAIQANIDKIKVDKSL
jgi:glycerol-3-phosphate acyltransferase PlsX